MMSRARGFTLLEMLVAVAIFALVSVMAYGGLAAVMQQYEVTSAAQSRLQEIRRAVTLLERDIFQLENRPVREAFQGDPQPALRGGVDQMLPLELTRGGWRNPAGLRRANLQRVAWQLSENKLQRLHWNVLDQAQDSEPQRLEVLDQVNVFELRFLDPGGNWHDQWPPLDFMRNPAIPGQSAGDEPLPMAIEFVLELEDAGRIRRLVELPRT